MIKSWSQSFLTLSLCIFRKPFLGLQGHNSPAFVPSGHLAVRERNAHSEHRDSCLVGGCRQDLLLQRRQVRVGWLLVAVWSGRAEKPQRKQVEPLMAETSLQTPLFTPENKLFVIKCNQKHFDFVLRTGSRRLHSREKGMLFCCSFWKAVGLCLNIQRSLQLRHLLVSADS